MTEAPWIEGEVAARCPALWGINRRPEAERGRAAARFLARLRARQLREFEHIVEADGYAETRNGQTRLCWEALQRQGLVVLFPDPAEGRVIAQASAEGARIYALRQAAERAAA